MTIYDAAMEAAVAGAVAAAAARVDETEQAGRLPDDLADRFKEAGLFRQLVPRSLGGAETHPAEFVESVERMAKVNGSAAWCVMIGATSGALAGRMDAAGAREVFGDPLGCWGGAYAPLGRAAAVDEGWQLSGRWPWGSGSQHCTWMAGGAVCDDGVFRLLFVPADQVRIIENWDVVGMRGTGSHDWSVKDATVPRSRAIDLLTGSPVEDGPLYRFPVFGLLALGLSAVSLGLGAAALDALAELAGGKTPSLQKRTLAERGTVQAEVAKATATLRSARAYVMDAIEESWAAAEGGDDPSIEQRANLRLAATHAAHSVTDVVRAAYTLAGGTAVRNDAPFGRLLRDAHVVTQHLMVSPVTYEPAGRVLLGLPIEILDL